MMIAISGKWETPLFLGLLKADLRQPEKGMGRSRGNGTAQLAGIDWRRVTLE
jgi:hypothetical protein